MISNKIDYTATRSQNLMKEARRNNVDTYGLIEQLRKERISEKRFMDSLADLVKQSDMKKNHRAQGMSYCGR